jgi:hypothetical protein
MMPFSIGPVTVEIEHCFFAEVYHGRWIRAIMRLSKAYLANVFYRLTDLKGPIRPTLCYHATSSLILYKPRSYDAIHFNISSFDLFGIVNGADGLRTAPVSIVENVDFARSGIALKRLSGLAVDRSLRDPLFP